MEVKDIITLIVAFGGWFMAAFIAWLNYRSKSDEIFFESLDWLSGKSQRRNIGISVVEAYWNDQRLKSISIPLLSNSAIYLLLESGQDEAAHELNNLERIMNLLLGLKRLSKGQEFYYQELYCAVKKKAQGNWQDGLKVPPKKLEEWDEELTRLLGSPKDCE